MLEGLGIHILIPAILILTIFPRRFRPTVAYSDFAFDLMCCFLGCLVGPAGLEPATKAL